MVLDYEERYGEHVGFCRVHHQRVLGTCDDCEQDDPRQNYDHSEKCNYCGREYLCRCDWPSESGAMCPRCDLEGEMLKSPRS